MSDIITDENADKSQMKADSNYWNSWHGEVGFLNSSFGGPNRSRRRRHRVASSAPAIARSTMAP